MGSGYYLNSGEAPSVSRERIPCPILYRYTPEQFLTWVGEIFFEEDIDPIMCLHYQHGMINMHQVEATSEINSVCVNDMGNIRAAIERLMAE